MKTVEEVTAFARAATAGGDETTAAMAYGAHADTFLADTTLLRQAVKALADAGELGAAAALLTAALTRTPDNIVLLQMLAGLSLQRGNVAPAIAALTDVTRLAPEPPENWLNLAFLHTQHGAWHEAHAAVKQALARAPQNAKAQKMAVGIEAEIAAMEATEEDLRLGFEADERHDYVIARARYEAALARNPGLLLARSRLVSINSLEGRLEEADTQHKALCDVAGQVDLNSLHWAHLARLAYQDALRPLPRPLYDAICTALDTQLQAFARQQQPVPVPPRPPRRLKVGYLSTFLRDHPLGHVTQSLFANHDTTAFEIYVFYRPETGANPYTENIARAVEHFVPLSGSIADMTRAVSAAELDLLIYLDGYMSISLLPIVAARPAPLQIFWLGHVGGCDITAIDYIIADKVVVPPGEDTRYQAKVARLPQVYHCASPHPIANTPSCATEGLPERGFVFCAFNNPEKIDTIVFARWMRILLRVEGSVLWLSQTGSVQLADNLRTAAAAHGVDGARLIFAPRVPDKSRHLARHGLCGLFLDTFTLTAGTTALDALWSGLPVLTVTGDRFASRMATSLVGAIGLADMACADADAYEDRAVVLANDPAALAYIRTRLAANRETHPLFRADVFCRALEDTLRMLHKTHRR